MIVDDIKNYRPCNEQEQRDKDVILNFIAANADAFCRTNLVAHMTASAWVVNNARDRVLMVYHNIYDSWSWTGGHADGETDLLSVALREVREETGLEKLKLLSDGIFSLEVLTVDAQNTRSDARPQTRTIAFHLSSEERDTALQGAHALGAQTLQLVGKNMFKPLRACSEEFKLIVCHRGSSVIGDGC